MPTSSAVLSAVPNQLMARSFAHAGAMSIIPPPMTAKGLAEGATTAAASSPSPAPSAVAETPATAASRSGVRDDVGATIGA